MRRMINGLAILGFVLLLSTTTFAQGKGNGGGKGGGGNNGGGDEPSTPLPSVRFEINRVDLPAAYSTVNDVNNLGEVVGWVRFRQGDGTIGPWHAYLATPGKSEATSEFVLLESIVNTSNLPADTWLASAVGINDHGVVVGYTLNDADERYPFAIDLALDNPVVDLLPRTGFVFDYARRINNRGEIIGAFVNPLDPETNDDDYFGVWYLDLPMLYGDPATRIPRGVDELGNPLPIDMSHQFPVSLDSILGSTSTRTFISNPSGNTPTFIGGVSSINTPFRLNVNTMTAEFLTDFLPDGPIAGMDASGAVVGKGLEPAKGKKFTEYGYRYTDTLHVLPESNVVGAGRVGDVLFARTDKYAIYRDWQDGLGPRSVSLNDLVIGTKEDLAIWDNGVSRGVRMSSEGVVALRLSGGTVDQLVTLFEVPVP